MVKGSLAWSCRARHHACLNVRRREPGSTPEVKVLSVDGNTGDATTTRTYSAGSAVHPAAAFAGCSPCNGRRLRRLSCGVPSCLFRAAWQCLFGWAAEKVAGGIGLGHRVGVVDVEDQGKMERVGAGGQGFVQDTVPADAFEGDAPQLVLVEEVSGDWFTA
jgi:hypothetical protein